jgi:hypothetical protein
MDRIDDNQILKMKINISSFFAIGTLAWTSAVVAQPPALYNNLSETPQGYNSIVDLGPLYNSFSTTSSPFLLSTVNIRLEGDPSVSPSATISVDLVSNSGTATPGSVLNHLGNVAESDLLAGGSVFTFNLGTAFPLAASTRYWIEVHSSFISTQSTAGWSYASYNNLDPGVANEFISTSGTTSPNTDGPFMMSVLGTAVPEPASFGCALVASLAGVAAVAARRKSRQ